MTEKIYRSSCCNAKVITDGVPDFSGSKEGCTFNYVCLRCNKPCDVVKPTGQKRKVSATEKSKAKLTVKKRQLAELQNMERRLLKSKQRKKTD